MANKLTPMPLLPVSQGAQGTGTAFSLQLTSTGTSVNHALPTDSTGNAPRMVYVQALGTGYMRLSVGAGAATVNDLAVTINNPVVLPCGGFTYVNFISDSGTVKCNVTSLEIA